MDRSVSRFRKVEKGVSARDAVCSTAKYGEGDNQEDDVVVLQKMRKGVYH